MSWFFGKGEDRVASPLQTVFPSSLPHPLHKAYLVQEKSILRKFWFKANSHQGRGCADARTHVPFLAMDSTKGPALNFPPTSKFTCKKSRRAEETPVISLHGARGRRVSLAVVGRRSCLQVSRRPCHSPAPGLKPAGRRTHGWPHGAAPGTVGQPQSQLIITRMPIAGGCEQPEPRPASQCMLGVFTAASKAPAGTPLLVTVRLTLGTFVRSRRSHDLRQSPVPQINDSS